MSQISLTFPDGNARDYDAGITPAEVAESISKSLSKKAISATVNGAHWDLQWPIENDAQIAINTMQDDAPALELIRHDLAHIMARAVQEIWPDVNVTIGPVRDNGWFYDFDREEPFTPEDLGAIEKRMKEIINARDAVRTELWSREKVRQHYTDNGEPYKVEILDKIPEGEDIRMYWHGDWMDLCRGPHLQHTGQVPADAFKLMNVSAAYFLGDNNRPMLQRIYGVAFRNRDDLKKYLTFLEEADKRDHRRLGREMNLFHMQEEAPGQMFWHPNGWTHLYALMEDYMRRKLTTARDTPRSEHSASGRPQALGSQRPLGQVPARTCTSPRWTKSTPTRSAVNALKPMNCPGHVQIFNHRYQVLPRSAPAVWPSSDPAIGMRPHGALHGLMRVRGFTQDDAHIFCTRGPDRRTSAETLYRLPAEQRSTATRAFRGSTSSSPTRPEVRAGADAVWDKAEGGAGRRPSDCRGVATTTSWTPARAPFTGPSWISSSHRRDWPRMAVRHLPGRFRAAGAARCDLYRAPTGRQASPGHAAPRHRSASFESFIGILIEELRLARLPFWLAPRAGGGGLHRVGGQRLCPRNRQPELTAAGLRAEADTRNEKINYKVREHSASARCR